MDMRTETPEVWFTSGLCRACKVISPTISFMKAGACSAIPSTDGMRASCSTIASSRARVGG